MAALQSPEKELDEKFLDLVVRFAADVTYGKLRGSSNVALSMVTLLETIINESEHTTAYELCKLVRAAGKLAADALPNHFAVANVTRRILRAIRDENRASANQSGEASGESLQRLVQATVARRATLGSASNDLREPLREHIAELRTELESSSSTICAAATEQILDDEVILAYGSSDLTEQFLLAAASRNYRLILAPGLQKQYSDAMALRLSNAGISVTLISNATIFAVMCRVNKVVMSVRAALGGGAALFEGGALNVTVAAKFHCVPVIALAPLYKLCPIHASDAMQFNVLGPPHNSIDYSNHLVSKVHVYSPRYDFASPDYISLFITNTGGSSPTYMYRLLSELYDPNDYTL